MDTNTQLQNILNRYNGLLDQGNEKEARTFVMAEFPKLPQDVKEQLLGEMLTIAIEDKVEEREATRELHEEGITAFKALNAIEEDVKSFPDKA